MKRHLIYAALSLCLLLAGCSGEQESPAPTPASPSDLVVVEPAPAEQETPVPAEEPQPNIEEPVEVEPPFQFRPGIWLAKNDVGYTAYYEFRDDEPFVTSCELDYGIMQGFTYEGSGNDLTFTLVSYDTHGGLNHDVLAHAPSGMLPPSDSHFPVLVEAVSEEELILHWEHALPETLTLVQNGEVHLEDFPFHCNSALAQLALDYYTANSGVPAEEMEGMQLGVMTNVDNSVTIQLYQNLGDHNSTAAWYVVDRFTATGTDLTSGQEIDLLRDRQEEDLPNEPVEDLPVEDAPVEELPVETPETEEIPVEEIPAEEISGEL